MPYRETHRCARLRRLPHAEAPDPGRDTRRDDGSLDPAPATRRRSAGERSPSARSSTPGSIPAKWFPTTHRRCRPRRRTRSIVQSRRSHRKAISPRGCRASARRSRNKRPHAPSSTSNSARHGLPPGSLCNAITAFEEAVKRKPDSPVALLNLADALTQAGQTPRAAATLSHALKVAPGDPLLWYQLGVTQSAAEHDAAAIAAFEKAVSLDPDFVEAHNAAGRRAGGPRRPGPRGKGTAARPATQSRFSRGAGQPGPSAGRTARSSAGGILLCAIGAAQAERRRGPHELRRDAGLIEPLGRGTAADRSGRKGRSEVGRRAQRQGHSAGAGRESTPTPSANSWKPSACVRISASPGSMRPASLRPVATAPPPNSNCARRQPAPTTTSAARPPRRSGRWAPASRRWSTSAGEAQRISTS